MVGWGVVWHWGVVGGGGIVGGRGAVWGWRAVRSWRGSVRWRGWSVAVLRGRTRAIGGGWTVSIYGRLENKH